MLKRVLVANRGEIALRVIRACHELGSEAIAVYSDADRDGLPARLADGAYRLGPPPVAQSYLRARRLIAIARRAGCDGLHPGYGLLAENAEFAAQVEAAGLAFVGPSPNAIRLMGDKVAARRLARERRVPTVPGSFAPLPDLAQARRQAERLGYPVLLKAAAGGGGKGLRLVSRPDELENAYERAAAEVAQGFADRSLYLEKFIPRAKHIEVQVLADGAGQVLHCYERDCSVQRRHQKLIEESPAPRLGSEKRAELGRAALEITRACGYRSAGTVEFLYDITEERYYFLEMNTRIQVEHPVSELVTGIDLVQQQLRLASGEKLSLTQQQLRPRGAALECRIYAEDAQQDFAPSLGQIEELILPSGPGVRVDSGVDRGDLVTRYYDPLLLKLIVWAEDRPGAIARMERALKEFTLVGVATTAEFHRRALRAAGFLDGSYDTDFVASLGPPGQLDALSRRQLAVAAALLREAQRAPLAPDAARTESAWKGASWPDETLYG